MDGRTLRTEELSGDVQGLAADDNDLLAAQHLLGNDAGKTAQKVALAVNDDLGDAQVVSNSSSSCIVMLVVPCVSTVAHC